jgi:hypothetical protein
MHVKKNNWNLSKNDYDMNFWKEGPFQDIQIKIHNFLWLKVFVAKVLHLSSFSFNISFILSFYKIYPKKIIKKMVLI